MLDLNHSCFSAKILLLRGFCNSSTTLGRLLNIALDTFIIDTGLGGNVFNINFKKFGGLAIHGWFRHLWELCNFLEVNIEAKITKRFCLVKKGDIPFMEELIFRNREAKCFGDRELEAIGRYLSQDQGNLLPFGGHTVQRFTS